ncbi:hypothetical protein [Paenibacillus castaneae]|uniref:hypothetical protein n=1 Tax=Paenibacillus castaneae TaxID=474957 RepID=UPI001ABA1F87|nr:hypothetical protein [Paenibacillus castaneae]
MLNSRVGSNVSSALKTSRRTTADPIGRSVQAEWNREITRLCSILCCRGFFFYLE